MANPEGPGELGAFFDSDDGFAQQVTFTKQNGATVDAKVIFDREGIRIDADGLPIASTSPSLQAATADIAGVDKGAHVDIGIDRFLVSERRDDGTGVTTLFLRLR